MKLRQTTVQLRKRAGLKDGKMVMLKILHHDKNKQEGWLPPTKRASAVKTRMNGLSCGEKIMTIRSAVLIQYQRVTDRLTGGQNLDS